MIIRDNDEIFGIIALFCSCFNISIENKQRVLSSMQLDLLHESLYPCALWYADVILAIRLTGAGTGRQRLVQQD